jgi:hypothetical protein
MNNPIALNPPSVLLPLLTSLEAQLDPHRLTRGLAGFRSGAVEEVWVAPAWIGGRIRGREGLAVTEIHLFDSQLQTLCTCQDTVHPCAHTAALAAAAAKHLKASPQALLCYEGRAVRSAPLFPGKDWLEFWGEKPEDETLPLFETEPSAIPQDLLLHLQSAPRFPDGSRFDEVLPRAYPVLQKN